MNKKVGIILGAIVAVVAIVVGVIFLTKDNSTSENIGANIVDICDSLEITDWKTTGIRGYGIAEDAEFSEGYVTSAGTVYVIRDTRKGESDEQCQEFSTTYIALETEEKVWIDKCLDYGDSYIPELSESLELKLADIDEDGIEEIFVLLSVHNHGAPGRGQYVSMVWKICDNGIKEIFNGEDFDNGFEIQLAKDNTAIVKNSAFNFEKTLYCYNDEGLFFDENGHPIPDSNYDSIHGIWNMEVKDVNGDGENELICKQWMYLSDALFEEHDAVTVLKYNGDTEEFEIVDAYVEITVKPSYVPFDEVVENGVEGNSVYDVVFDAYKDFETYDGYVCGYVSYAFCDLDKNGTDELIIETSTCEADRLYHFYTFDGERIVDVGQINGWHTTLFENDGNVEATAGHSMGMMFTVYEFTGENLVQISYEEFEYDENEEPDLNLGTEIEFTYVN